MNAIIQKLMDRSFTDHQDEQFDPERFAKLIVQECINACGSDFGTESIKKHFGMDSRQQSAYPGPQCSPP